MYLILKYCIFFVLVLGLSLACSIPVDEEEPFAIYTLHEELIDSLNISTINGLHVVRVGASDVFVDETSKGSLNLLLFVCYDATVVEILSPSFENGLDEPYNDFSCASTTDSYSYTYVTEDDINSDRLLYFNIMATSEATIQVRYTLFEEEDNSLTQLEDEIELQFNLNGQSIALPSQIAPNINVYVIKGKHGFVFTPTETYKTEFEYINQFFDRRVGSPFTLDAYFEDTNIEFTYSKKIYQYVRYKDVMNSFQCENLLVKSSILELTDVSGTEYLGELEVDYQDNVSIFWGSTVEYEDGPLGVYYGYDLDAIICMENADVAVYNGRPYVAYYLFNILAHELGHFFGLPHSFSRSSCAMKPEATTMRIMDYSSEKYPLFWEDCEKDIIDDFALYYIP